MPDNDFDNLFKDKLIDAEIEPSADLWANISEKIEPKRKRTVPIFWFAAASVVIVASATLVLQQPDKVYLQGTDKVATKVNTATPVVPVVERKDEQILPENASQNAAVQTLKYNKPEVKESVVKSEVKNIYIAMQPSSEETHLPNNSNNEEVGEKKSEVVVNNPQEEVIYALNDAEPKTPVVENVIAVNTPDQQMPKKGIRSFGDLVNFVMDKVDTREEKLITFKNDEENETSAVVGINLGFLKIGKRK